MRYDLRISGLSSVLWADAGAYFCAQFYRGTSLPLRGNDRPGSPQGCPVASRHSARRSGVLGTNLQNVPLEQVPLAGSTPLKGRQADFYKYQSGRRRTANSEASPNQKPRRTVLYSPAEVDAQRAAPRKGFLNRRFKRVFANFCRAAKVGQGSGGGQPTGYQQETTCLAATAAKKKGINTNGRSHLRPLPRRKQKLLL